METAPAAPEAQPPSQDEAPVPAPVIPHELSRNERAVLALFHERCRIAGAFRPGYVMRPESFEGLTPNGTELESSTALNSLVGKGVLVANEERSRYYLTEMGAELLGRNPTRFE